jgi:LemA protein
VKEAWSTIDTQLKRRYDLIPNLLETVKAYMKYEKGTFQAVVEARNAAMKVTSADKKGKAEENLSGALKSLFALSESYPDLKANENFRDLQAQLEGTENRITVERRNFNEVARNYNTAVRTFPKNIFAGMFGFQTKPYFQAEAGAEKAPKVSFDD